LLYGTLAVAAVLGALGSFGVVHAAAQAGPTTTTVATTTTTVSSAGGTSLVSQHDAIPAALWALGFGLLAIAGVLLFLYFDRRRSFTAIHNLTSAGIPFAAAPEQALAGGNLGVVAPIADQPQIAGPAVISTGVTAPYTITPAPAAGTTVAWTVASGSAALSATTGIDTTLTATAVQNLVLRATLTPPGKGTPTPVDLTISVISGSAAQSQADRVPILGIGYGTVIIALAVASITTALGLTDVINGQAVAGILGSLVTYSVVRATSSSGSSTGGGSSGTGAGPGGS
jgi:hypothetical protein